MNESRFPLKVTSDLARQSAEGAKNPTIFKKAFDFMYGRNRGIPTQENTSPAVATEQTEVSTEEQLKKLDFHTLVHPDRETSSRPPSGRTEVNAENRQIFADLSQKVKDQLHPDQYKDKDKQYTLLHENAQKIADALADEFLLHLPEDLRGQVQSLVANTVKQAVADQLVITQPKGENGKDGIEIKVPAYTEQDVEAGFIQHTSYLARVFADATGLEYEEVRDYMVSKQVLHTQQLDHAVDLLVQRFPDHDWDQIVNINYWSVVPDKRGEIQILKNNPKALRKAIVTFGRGVGMSERQVIDFFKTNTSEQLLVKLFNGNAVEKALVRFEITLVKIVWQIGRLQHGLVEDKHSRFNPNLGMSDTVDGMIMAELEAHANDADPNKVTLEQLLKDLDQASAIFDFYDQLFPMASSPSLGMATANEAVAS